MSADGRTSPEKAWSARSRHDVGRSFRIARRLSHWLDEGGGHRRRWSHAFGDSRTHATRQLSGRQRPAAGTRVTPRLPTGPRGFFVGPDPRPRGTSSAREASRDREGEHERAGHRQQRHRSPEPRPLAGERGRRDRLRHPGRRDPAGLRPADRLHPAPAHPGPPRAGRRPRRRRATPQATGKVGVCMATSGPGATNLVTPIADAYMDSVPIVAITGQVASAAIGTDAFQEADIRGITMPITKHNFLVTDPADIPRTDRRGVPHRRHRPARPGAGRHRQGRPAGADDVRAGRPSSTCPATARSPGRTPSRCARPPG